MGTGSCRARRQGREARERQRGKMEGWGKSEGRYDAGEHYGHTASCERGSTGGMVRTGEEEANVSGHTGRLCR
jgi:hypothetical protein